jgi:hypothetical protein
MNELQCKFGYLVLSTKFQNSIAVEEAATCLLLLLLLSCRFFLDATAAAVFLRIFFSPELGVSSLESVVF